MNDFKNLYKIMLKCDRAYSKNPKARVRNARIIKKALATEKTMVRRGYI